VADGMVPLALGTQTGGSVIRPAAYCGVIGFKPTFGAINRTGVKPVADSLDTVGLFAETIEDAAKALQVLSGIAAPDLATPGPAPRIGFARTSLWDEADSASHAMLESSARTLAAAGAVVAEVRLPAAVDALFVEHRHIMKYEAARALAWEYANHRELLSRGLLERLEDGWALSRERYEAAQRIVRDARAQFGDFMRSFDLVLTLAAPGEAPKGIASTGDSIFNGLWTMLGVPCITLPCGSGPAGLPLGAQLVGAFGADTALLGRAQWVARHLGPATARSY
jgi:Asp-tRNA(Asn)/Glu-tRNA(Gln) amidotransferase A subunit family amidase